MAVDMITSALPLMNGGRLGSGGSHTTRKAEYKLRKHRLEKLDSTISELPLCFDELLSSLNGYCSSGGKLASLLEIVLEETPLLMVVSRYKESCEQLKEKCKRLEILLQPEFVAACRKIGPCVSQLRSSIDSHAKSLSKYESAQTQYENIMNSESASKPKIDQAETKFKNTLQEFANQDTHLAKATDELDKLRVEAMGSCFLSLLEAQSSLLNSAAEIMGPLGSYKEVGKGLIDTQSTSVVKEATLGWLAVAQVYRNLRTCGSMSRNDIQCMMFTGYDGLPDTIRKGLNNKVDQLLKSFTVELEKTHGTPRIVPGGFHLNPKGIELALKDCCSELEAVGAGAPHVQTRQEKEEQIDRDVPRTVFRIGTKELGGAIGSDIQDNIQDKLLCIEELASTLSITQRKNIASEKLHDYAFHVLNEACTTVTNTSAKTAVQLVYGKANLIFVRASPNLDDFYPVIISTKGDSSLQISVQSSWWLVEDYATLSSLSRLPQPGSFLGIIESAYTLELSLDNFISEQPTPEIPTISVQCTKVNKDYSSTLQYSNTTSNSPSTRKSKSSRNKYSSKKALATFQSYLPSNSSVNEDDRDIPHSRLPSSEGEGLTDGSDPHSSYGNSPSEGSSGRSGRSRSGSLGRGLKSLSGGLHKSLSNETISTTTSGVTLKAPQAFDEDITDLLPSEITNSRGLTQARVMALTRSEKTGNTHRYSKQRIPKDHQPSWGGDGRREERRDEWEQNNQHHQITDKESQNNVFPKKRNDSFTPATQAEFEHVFKYLDGYHQNPEYYEQYWRQDRKENGNGGRRKEDSFIDSDKGNEEHSQVVTSETDNVHPRNPHLMSNSSMGSIDSGIAMHPRGVNLTVGDRGRYHIEEDREDGNSLGLGYIITKGLGPFYPPMSSDSDSENTSGRNSRNLESPFGNFHTPSHDDLPGRSSSSASFHSMSHGVPPIQMDSGSLSLPDEFMPFNQAPGSHRVHQRHPSISSSSSDFGDPLSQQEHFDMPSSFSQEAPMQRPREDHEFHRLHFSGSYEPEIMRGRSQYHQYGSDPYPNPPHFPPERQSRSLNRGNDRIMHEDYSPGPMHRHHPHPPGPGGPFWDGYGPTPPTHMHGPPPPHSHPHPPPPRGHVPPFHPMSGFRPTTPDGSSMSPARSPNPTPPTTPPPSHPPMMGMGPSPMRMPPPHHGNLPPRGPPPLGPRGPVPMHGNVDFDYRIPHPPPPGPRGHPIPHPPGPMGPPPHHHPHPHGRLPPPHGHLDWGDPNWNRLH